MQALIFLFCFILSICFFIKYIQPVYDEHKKVTDGVINYDRAMRKFVYKVYMSREEIISSLKIMNIKDTLSCTFDFEKNTVLFTDLICLYTSIRKEYFYEIRECDGFSILKLSETSLISERNHIPYKLNPFLIGKINAEIIPFSQYGN